MAGARLSIRFSVETTEGKSFQPVLNSDPLSSFAPHQRADAYKRLLAGPPVYWSSVQAGWVLSRYADVSAMLHHPDALVLKVAPFIAEVGKRGNIDIADLHAFSASLSLLMRPPHHDKTRRLLAQVLGNFRRTELPAQLEAKARQLLEEGARNGSINLGAGYGRALPMFVASFILGIPESDHHEIDGACAALIGTFDRLFPSLSQMKALNGVAGTMMRYFERLIAQRRRSPGDDGLSRMIELSSAENLCSDRELAGFCSFFFIAAVETTASAIACGARMLVDRPELAEGLRRDASLLPAFASEILRLSSPVQYVAREAGRDFHIGGHSIPAGAGIVLMLGPANRDPEAFPSPDELNLDRTGPEPLAFAAGPYRCIGSHLATFEIQLAAKELLAWPQLRLSSETLVWSDRLNVARLDRCIANFGPES